MSDCDDTMSERIDASPLDLGSSFTPPFNRNRIGRQQQKRRCLCDECRGVIDILNDIGEENKTNDSALERRRNRELTRLNFA